MSERVPLEQTLDELQNILKDAHEGFDFAIVWGLIMSIVDRHNEAITLLADIGPKFAESVERYAKEVIENQRLKEELENLS